MMIQDIVAVPTNSPSLPRTRPLAIDCVVRTTPKRPVTQTPYMPDPPRSSSTFRLYDFTLQETPASLPPKLLRLLGRAIAWSCLGAVGLVVGGLVNNLKAVAVLASAFCGFYILLTLFRSAWRSLD